MFQTGDKVANERDTHGIYILVEESQNKQIHK